jgi:predicted RNA binding protein YcfA (HicA-like mRNA interferase family)
MTIIAREIVRNLVVQSKRSKRLKFNELVRLLERNGFKIIKEKGSIRYYSKPGWDRLIRVDYHGSKEVPSGTCHAIIKAAGIKNS